LRNLEPFQSCKKRNLPRIKDLHHLQQASKPLRNLLQPSHSNKKRKIAVNKTSKRDTIKQSKRKPRRILGRLNQSNLREPPRRILGLWLTQL
jgi:hypothetical protein